MEEYLNLQRERSHKNVVCEPLDPTELLMRHLGQRRTQLAGLRLARLGCERAVRTANRQFRHFLIELFRQEVDNPIGKDGHGDVRQGILSPRKRADTTCKHEAMMPNCMPVRRKRKR